MWYERVFSLTRVIEGKDVHSDGTCYLKLRGQVSSKMALCNEVFFQSDNEEPIVVKSITYSLYTINQHFTVVNSEATVAMLELMFV